MPHHQFPAQPVFPAHAGMFPVATPIIAPLEGFPRARGDVPGGRPSRGWGFRFSPRTRGCSSLDSIATDIAAVFPAHAGMFRSRILKTTYKPCFPRARGDVPQIDSQIRQIGGFSPRTRGCSYFRAKNFWLTDVFPAHAGMFRVRKSYKPLPLPFSPRTRGCSYSAFYTPSPILVFPAHAGMFRACPLGMPCCMPFSPRTRGCSFAAQDGLGW